jgi:division protein CdvB (Snf7/Vps24/ESCRT-III family)
VRKWLSDKGVLPELSELTSIGEDGKPLFNLPEIVKAHLEALSLSGISTIAEVQKVIKNNNAEMEKINPEPSAETSDSDNTTDNSDNADAASTDAASEEEPADNKAVGDDDALDDIE